MEEVTGVLGVFYFGNAVVMGDGFVVVSATVNEAGTVNGGGDSVQEGTRRST